MKIKYTWLIFFPLLIPHVIFGKKEAKQKQEPQWYQEYIEEILEEQKEQTPSQFAQRNLESLFNETLSDIHAPSQSIAVNHHEKIELLNNSLVDYIKEMYNDYKYAHYISQNGEDLLILLETVRDLDLGLDAPLFSYTILKLFHEKFKQCELVDDSMAQQILRKLPNVLNFFFNPQAISPLEQLKATLKRSIMGTFTAHLPLTQTDPSLFASLMSKKLGKVLKNSFVNALSRQEERLRLQNLIVRLLENILGKMMWSRTNYESFIPSLSATANQILMLVKAGIIEHADDYDSLLWSLTYRACYYLDLCGSVFPLDFYEDLECSIKNGAIPFLEEEEQDEYIITKKETFLQAIIRAKTQAFAYHREGIISAAAY